MKTGNGWKRAFLRGAGLLAGSILLGFVLLLLVYALPTARMKDHVRESAAMLTREGDYPEWAEGLSIAQGDQFTDSIMLREAITDTDMGLVQRALRNPFTFPGESEDPQTSYLHDTAEGNYTQEDTGTYARYWHGYLVFLKPMLLFFTVSEIRVFSMFVQAILLFICLLMISDRLNRYYAFAFLLAVLLLGPITTALCLQYQDVYLIILLTAIVLMQRKKKHPDSTGSDVFLLSGIAVAYFDFLTYPLAALMFPLCLHLAICSREHKLSWKSVLFPTLSWGTGYGCMWISKWILANLVTGENVIRDGWEKLLQRSSDSAGDVSVGFLQVVKANLGAFLSPVFPAIALIAAAAAAAFLIRNRRHLEWRRENAWYILIMAMPFAWYLVTRNHSYLHSLFTYRELAGTVLAGLCLVGAFVRKEASLHG